MNPKQLACVVLMMFIGGITYFGQIVHQKVVLMKNAAVDAEADAQAAESNRQTADILTARTKAETEEIRRFLKAWTPHVEKTQTEQEVESAIEFSLRDKGISLVRSRKSEVKNTRENPIIPRTVIATLTIEEKSPNLTSWLGETAPPLPLSRVKVCRFTGGGTGRQLRLDVSLETPLVNLAP